jgi:hypothetical protein
VEHGAAGEGVARMGGVLALVIVRAVDVEVAGGHASGLRWMAAAAILPAGGAVQRRGARTYVT